MAIFPRGKIWWYKFYFTGQQIRESSKSTSKTVAKNAERTRDGVSSNRASTTSNRRRNTRFTEAAAGMWPMNTGLITTALPRDHFRRICYRPRGVVRLLGDALLVDIDESTVLDAGTDRLKGSPIRNPSMKRFGFF